MTRLLVSVRDVDEARAALDGGAELVDVKEPHRGSLGMADPETIASVARFIDGRVALSAALGELIDFENNSVSSTALQRLQFAKLGLAGCAAISDWSDRWRRAWRRVPTDVARVAVVYADYEHACCPPPSEVIARGLEMGCRALLIDTYHKHTGGLLDHLGVEALSNLVESARESEMAVVLAGSLTPASIDRVLPLRPDFVAVRGAVCRGDRTGAVDQQRVCRLVAQVNSFAPSAA